jgi:hypothetical protein
MTEQQEMELVVKDGTAEQSNIHQSPPGEQLPPIEEVQAEGGSDFGSPREDPFGSPKAEDIPMND